MLKLVTGGKEGAKCTGYARKRTMRLSGAQTIWFTRGAHYTLPGHICASLTPVHGHAEEHMQRDYTEGRTH